MGFDDLRDAIVVHIAEDGVNATRDNVLVTNGAKHATELVLRIKLSRVIVTAPTYVTTLRYLVNHDVNFWRCRKTTRVSILTISQNALRRVLLMLRQYRNCLSTFPAFITRPGSRWR